MLKRGSLVLKVAKRMLSRPLTTVVGVAAGKQEDPQWLKWVKRITTLVVTVASAIAAMSAAIILACWL